jgi:O-antigen/teichoic acid export membrane protein
VKQLLKQVLLTKLVRASSWLFMGGIAGGILGYLFQIIMGRMLSVSEYGIFSALMAMMVVIGAPMISLSMIISRRVSAYRAEQANSKLGYLYYWINRKLFLILILLAVLVVLNIKSLQNFLLIEKNIYLYSLLLIILIAFPQAINNAYLQGLQYFKWLSFSGVLAAILKIIIASFLVYFGFGVSGALGGVIFSTFIILILTYVVLHPSLGKLNEKTSGATDLLFKSAIPVLLANVAFAVMTQIDMILVKHYFSEEDAGIYAAASILGKAVMYLPGGIAMALFPMVAENQASGKSSVNLIFQAVGVTAVLSLIGALSYYFLADYIIIYFYGVEYKEASLILKYFGFAIIPMGLIMVAEYFLIAMGRVLFAYLFIVMTPLQLFAIYHYHDTLLSIVMVLFVCGAILCSSGYGLLWREFKK